MKRNLKIIFFFIVILFLTFSIPIFQYKLCYILPLDNFDENYLLMKGFSERIRNFSLYDYEWSMVFGAARNCYTYIMSNLAILAVFISDNYLKYFSFVLTLIRIILIFFSSLLWTSKITDNKHSRLLGSLLFAFCGYVFFYISFSTFIEMMIFFPLIFYFTERYLQDNKFVGLVLIVGLLGLCNYYYCYMSVPVACLYALIRYIKINEKNLHLAKIFFNALKFVGYYLLGIGLAALVIIPCAYIFVDLGRFSSSTSPNFLTHLDFSGIYGLLTSFYTPVFESMSFNPFIHGGIQCTIFSYMLGAFILPLSFRLKNKVDRYSMIGVFIFFGFALFFTYFWYIFERVIDGRWFFYITLFIVYALVLVIDEYEQSLFNKKEVIYTLVVNTMMLFLVYIIGMKYNSTTMLLNNFKLLLPFYICLFAYFLYFYFNAKKFIILLVIFSSEIVFSGYIYFINNKPLPVEFFEHEGELSEVISKIETQDTSFYRIQLDTKTLPKYYNTYNIPYAYGFKGLSGYSSTYEGEMRDYLNRIDGSMWMFNQLYGRVDMYNLLSTKYFISYDSDENVPSGYQFLFEHKDFQVYENNNYIELGYASNNVIHKSFLDELPYIYQDQVLANYISIEEKKENITIDYKQNLQYLGTLSTDSYREIWFDHVLDDGTIYIDNRGIPELKVSLCNTDGCKVRQTVYQFDYQDYRVSSEDQISYMIVEGDDVYDTNLYMEVYFKSDKSLETEAVSKNTFYNTGSIIDKVYGSIDISEDNTYVFTSIPFNQGWTVKANGAKVDTFKVNNGFIGFKLNKGIYKIEASFSEKGKRLGILISITSLIIVIFLYIKSKFIKL